MLSCEFCKIFQNTYFVKQLRMAVSVHARLIPTWRKVCDLLFIYLIQLCQNTEI